MISYGGIISATVGKVRKYPNVVEVGTMKWLVQIGAAHVISTFAGTLASQRYVAKVDVSQPLSEGKKLSLLFVLGTRA